MKFLIPSYKRAGIASTIDYLISMRVPYGDILVGVQTSEDYDAYSKAYRHVPLLLNDAHNVAGNRNALIGTLEQGERAILLDDDLHWLAKAWIDGGKARTSRISTPHEFRRFIDDAFEIADGGIWGVKLGVNFLKQALETDNGLNKDVCIGNLLGFTYDAERHLSFDSDLNDTEEYDVIFNAVLVQKMKIVKISCYCAEFNITVRKSLIKAKPYNMLSGGNTDMYLAVGRESWVDNSQLVESRYPGLVEIFDFETGRMKFAKEGRKRALANWGEESPRRVGGGW